ncbi:MAG: glycosyltransferase [Phycisphaerales bacterium]|nr:MAG: glycosyltransferase [Phycisphaerales bacterium]
MANDGKITVALLWKASGGNVTSVNDLAGALDGDRFDVVFIFLGGPAEKATWMEQGGHKVFYLSDKRRLGLLSPAKILKLIRILRLHRVDILHCHNHKANVYGVLAGTLARTPVVLAQIHGLERARNLRRKITNLLLFRKARRIVAVADAVQEDVLANNWRVPREKLFVLENSVDYARFADPSISRSEARRLLGIELGAVVFGTIGRLAPTKGLPYLIRAFSVVWRDVPAAHLVVLGDGPCRGELERHVAQMHCRDAIHFLGYQPNVEHLLKGMDVFVLSSVAEGMPRVILEAMAAGVPCVSTAVGGIPEMFGDGTLGVLVPPRDPEKLAAAMTGWLNMSELERQERVEKAKDHARRHHSHEVLVAKLSRLYESEFSACRARKDAVADTVLHPH